MSDEIASTDPYWDNRVGLSANAFATSFDGKPANISCSFCEAPAITYLFMGQQFCRAHAWSILGSWFDAYGRMTHHEGKRIPEPVA